MRRNDKPQFGLAKGQIETHINSTISMHFNYIKEELAVDKNLLEQLKRLCTVNSDSLQAEITESTNILPKKSAESYEMIAMFIRDPKAAFATLRLKDNELDEIYYAIQKNLYGNICDFLKEKRTESQHREWMNQTYKHLDDKFKSLPRRQVIHRNYNLAASNAGSFVANTAAVILCMALLFQLYRLHTLYNSDTISDRGKMELLPAYISAILCSIIVPTMVNRSFERAHGFFQRMHSALTENVVERTIQAQGPDDNSSREVSDLYLNTIRQ